MKPTVVILLSDKRSGSTQFERELCRHSKIQHVEYCTHSYNETHHWLKSAVVLDMPSRHFARGRTFRNYGGKRGARALLVDQLLGNLPDVDLPKEDRQLVFQGWEALCRRFAQPVFFEKSPQHLAHWSALSLMLEWARETDLDVRFIGLVRNPAAVLCSAWELFGSAPEARMEGWVEIHRNLLAFQSMIRNDQYLQITYEQMVATPHETFDAVLNFIGLDRDESIGSNVHAQSIDKWRRNSGFNYQPSTALLQMAECFGYSIEEITPPSNHRLSSKSRLHKLRLRKLLRNRFLNPALAQFKRAR